MRLVRREIVRTNRFSSSLAGIADLPGVERQIHAVEWALARGLSIQNFPALSTPDGRQIHIYKTLGIIDCPGLVLLLEQPDSSTIVLHDVRLAIVNKNDD